MGYPHVHFKLIESVDDQTYLVESTQPTEISVRIVMSIIEETVKRLEYARDMKRKLGLFRC